MINLKDYEVVNNVASPKPAKKSRAIHTKEISKKTLTGKEAGNAKKD